MLTCSYCSYCSCSQVIEGEVEKIKALLPSVVNNDISVLQFEHDIKEHEITFKIKVKNVKEAETAALKKENADIKEQLAEMQAKMEAMMAAAAPPPVE